MTRDEIETIIDDKVRGYVWCGQDEYGPGVVDQSIGEAASAVYDALLAAGVIPAEGMVKTVTVPAERYGQLEAIRVQTGRFLALTCYGPRTSSHCGPNTPTELARHCPPDDWQRIMRGMARAYYDDYDDIPPGDLDAIPDAPTGEGER